MRHFCTQCVFVLSAILPSVSAQADINLPVPQMKDGLGVFSALNDRHSATSSDFPLKNISVQELSNLLWAATGQNRDKKSWTIPLALSNSPYNKIYVLEDNGVYWYDWKQNKLIEVSRKNIKKDIGLQKIVEKSPVVLVFVTDNNSFGLKLKNWTIANPEILKDFSLIASGAMAQNIYLAAASMGIEARFVISMKKDIVHQQLQLNKDDIPLNFMLIGKK